MGIIATNNREIKFYYSSATGIGKQALPYVRASDKKIDENDWFNILQKCPQVFHQPILVNKNKTLQIKTPSEIVSFPDSEN